jgi:methylmalonyl-CoA/ethylmalonyl-CoA epimerase
MSATANLAIDRLGQVAVVVTDLERSTRFYRDVLGLPLLLQVPGMSFLRVGETRLMLGQAEPGKEPPRASILYFRVPDARAGEAALRAAGVEITGPAHFVARMGDHDLWIAFFADPDGNPMALMAEHRPGA